MTHHRAARIGRLSQRSPAYTKAIAPACMQARAMLLYNVQSLRTSIHPHRDRSSEQPGSATYVLVSLQKSTRRSMGLTDEFPSDPRDRRATPLRSGAASFAPRHSLFVLDRRDSRGGSPAPARTLSRRN